MSIAKILAPVTGAKRDEVVIRSAIAAARPFNAHVEALFVHPDPRLAVPFTGVPVSPSIIQDIVDSVAALARDAAVHARDTVRAIARAEDLQFVEKPCKSDAVTCSFRSVEGLAAQRIGEAAEYADLVVFGPLATADGPDFAESFLETLTRTDRPVLICPEVPARLTYKIAIGWDGGLAAAHAVTAALPYVERAERVEILTVRRPSKTSSFTRIRDFLALHGITATERLVDKGERSTGQALLETAATSGADLLVMGGYGHGYLRETILGGVTAHVRWHATIPVFMMH